MSYIIKQHYAASVVDKVHEIAKSRVYFTMCLLWTVPCYWTGEQPRLVLNSEKMQTSFSCYLRLLQFKQHFHWPVYCNITLWTLKDLSEVETLEVYLSIDLLQGKSCYLLSLKPFDDLRNHKFGLFVDHAKPEIAHELQTDDLAHSFFINLLLFLEQLQITMHWPCQNKLLAQIRCSQRCQGRPCLYDQVVLETETAVVHLPIVEAQDKPVVAADMMDKLFRHLYFSFLVWQRVVDERYWVV